MNRRDEASLNRDEKHPDDASANKAATEDSSQLLPKKAEEYLREGGNIEDMPNEEDEAAKEDVLKEQKP